MALTDVLKDIGGAIRAKDGTAALIPFLDMSQRILAIPSGGGSEAVKRKDVNFYDYDGTLLHSYTKTEAAALTALPAAPSHNGLIFQEWNYTLANVNAAWALDIGATYRTVSGATEFDIVVNNVTGKSLTVMAYNASGTMTIDWGDGKTDSGTGSLSKLHVYGANGNYTISIDSTGTYYLFGTSSSPWNMFRVTPENLCTAIRIGDRCTSIDAYSFYNYQSLRTITIPNTLASIGTHTFYGCFSLTSIVIPNGITTIGDRCFNTCYNLENIIIPNSVTTIGQYTFVGCYGLTSFIVPSGVKTINAYAFQGLSMVKEYILLPTTPPTLANTNTFTNINYITIMTVPNGRLAAYQGGSYWSTYANYMREATA